MPDAGHDSGSFLHSTWGCDLRQGLLRRLLEMMTAMGQAGDADWQPPDLCRGALLQELDKPAATPEIGLFATPSPLGLSALG